MGSAQLPNIVTALGLKAQWGTMHYRRKMMAVPFVVASVVYVPSLLLTIVTHVLPGSLVFWHLTLLYSVASALFQKLVGAATALKERKEKLFEPLRAPEQENMESASENQPAPSLLHRGTSYKDLMNVPVPIVSLETKFLLVPTVIYIQFVGEAMARFYAGENWWESQYHTWAERTLPRYVGHLEGSAKSAIFAVLRFF